MQNTELVAGASTTSSAKQQRTVLLQNFSCSKKFCPAFLGYEVCVGIERDRGATLTTGSLR